MWVLGTKTESIVKAESDFNIFGKGSFTKPSVHPLARMAGLWAPGVYLFTVVYLIDQYMAMFSCNHSAGDEKTEGSLKLSGQMNSRFSERFCLTK